MKARDQVLRLLVERSYLYDEKGFNLASGGRSNTYINCKETTMRKEAAAPLAELFENYVPPAARAVGGLTAGADPIAYAMRDFCSRAELDAFMVRKEAKKHGLKHAIEGPVTAGMQVVVVDDVVTTGSSTIRAIEECRQAGLIVAAVIVLVDREEGGLGAITDQVGPKVPVHAIFTRSELHAEWSKRRDADADTRRPAATAR